MFGLVTRRRHEQELDAAKAETARQRRAAEAATSRAITAEFNRDQILRQLAEADATNRRIDGRNKALNERITALTESNPECLADLEKQLAAAREELTAEKQRGDRLQERLDDAVGLPRRGPIKDSSDWQPANQKKKAGTS